MTSPIPTDSSITLPLAGTDFLTALAAFVAACDMMRPPFWAEYKILTADAPIHDWDDFCFTAMTAMTRAEEQIGEQRRFVTCLGFIQDIQEVYWGTGRTRVRLAKEEASGNWFVTVWLENEQGSSAQWKNPVVSLADRVLAGLGLVSDADLDLSLRNQILLAAAAYERRMVEETRDEEYKYVPSCLPTWEENFQRQEQIWFDAALGIGPTVDDFEEVEEA